MDITYPAVQDIRIVSTPSMRARVTRDAQGRIKEAIE